MKKFEMTKIAIENQCMIVDRAQLAQIGLQIEKLCILIKRFILPEKLHRHLP